MTKSRHVCVRLSRFQPGLESLERRDMLAWSPQIVDISEVEPNDVLTQAQDLGPVDLAQRLNVRGSIGAGADVDFYRFGIDQAEKITLTLTGFGILSLYENDPLAAPLGHPLILQFATVGPAVARSINLLAGEYEVAVSGAGDRYFSPVLADSGTVGGQGSYALSISGDNPDFDASVAVPLVRTDIPANGYAASPLAIHLTLTQPLDLSQDYVTIVDSQQDDMSPNLSWHPAVNELVITPLSGLDIGPYQIVGYDADGNQILSVPFSVVGRKGSPAAMPTSDTLATATPLSDITDAGLVQVAGAIGTDPYYNAANTDPTATNPADQVDMYRFLVSGAGQYVLTAEAFAGRIGSPLDPALTLFRMSGVNSDGTPAWQLVAGNDNQNNPTVASDGSVPLYTDPALFVGLTAGRYVIAVSASDNYADPLLGMTAGTGGRFDPNQSHSGVANKATTGAYVLNLLVRPADPAPPTVTYTSVPPGAVLTGPPTTVTVQFSTPVNLVALAVLSGQQGQVDAAGEVNAVLWQRFPVYVEDAAGQRHLLALASYNTATGVATFTVLDRLTDGSYTLHLSGPGGLTDFAGNPLSANDFSGDYIVPFAVTSSPPLPALLAPNAQDGWAAHTDLGVLFPAELASGINVRRDFQSATPQPADQADFYRFTLLQDASLILTLAGPDVVGRPVLLDAQGNPAYPAIAPKHPNQHQVNLLLCAGTYTIEVGGWTAAGAAKAVYTLSIVQAGFQENPTPLTTGPAPAIRLRLDSAAPSALAPSAPNTSGPPPQLTLPGPATPSITLTVDRSAASAALPNVPLLPGTAAGLAAGPVGVVSSVPAANDTVRLVLPGTEFPVNPVASRDETPSAGTIAPAQAGMVGLAMEGALRAILYYSIDWLRLPPLMPRLLDLEGEAPSAAEPPDGGDLASAGSDIRPATWAIALALAGRTALEQRVDASQRAQRKRKSGAARD
jgi:hypothetical protein